MTGRPYKFDEPTTQVGVRIPTRLVLQARHDNIDIAVFLKDKLEELFKIPIKMEPPKDPNKYEPVRKYRGKLDRRRG